nr:protein DETOXIFICATION 29-like [Ipomoea batatas]
MADDNTKQPLLSPAGDDHVVGLADDEFLLRPSLASFRSSFVPDPDDIPPITGARDFFREFRVESRKLWYLAGPAVFTSICQYSLGAITQTFAGHLSTIDLAAVTVENSVIAGFSFGVMLGMGSALETLCGQAFGAGQIDMLGVYMQRSWVILNATAVILTALYVAAAPFLRLIGQTEEISAAAGRMALYMIPQLYAYAMNFPIAKFLQAQSKMMVMAWVSGAAIVMHTLLSWLFMLRLLWGLAGAAAVLNFSWWFIVVAQLIYIFSGTCGQAWSGFSPKAFQNLWSFVRLSLASAVMLCLETWYFMALVLFAGYLKNAEVAVDALSICTNILGWAVMVAIGLNAAISVRVSNELGAGHPRTAKFSVVVVVMSSFVLGVLISAVLLIFRRQYPALFADDEVVKALVYNLTPLLATCIVVSNIQPTLSGVAIGGGWQALVAYVNIACYYLLGIPAGLIMGYVLNMGLEGIWYGMLGGTVVQTLVLFWIVYKTNWNKEASIAADRIKQWAGEPEIKEVD